MEKTVPAPWELNGNGYIMLFKFPKQFICEKGFLEERFQKGFFGNLGGIIFLDNQRSNIGPYQELLFIPGKTRYQKRKAYTISKIFVSTMESKENGVKNWGIPKEIASFRLSTEQDLENIKVIYQGKPVIDISIKTKSGLAFPLSTRWWPIPLVQHIEDKTFWFNCHGKGMGRLAQIMKVDVNPEFFPNFAFFKHVAIIKVNNLKMKLPVAKVKDDR